MRINKMPTQRCSVCAKKVGMVGFECRCTNVLCAEHRLPFHHQCPVDVKVIQHQKLQTECPKVVQEKMIKI